MARSGRTVVAGEVVGSWRDDRRVVRLTDQILDLHAKATARMVTAIIEIGRRMARVEERLSPDEWKRWVSDLRLHPRTIGNYIALAEFSDRAPTQVQRFGHLGPTKLYVLAGGKSDKVRRLKIDVPISIPGGGGRKTVGDMTTTELRRVVGDFTANRTPRPPIGKLVQATAHKIGAVEALVDQLEHREDELPDGAADELAVQLRALADRLDALD